MQTSNQIGFNLIKEIRHLKHQGKKIKRLLKKKKKKKEKRKEKKRKEKGQSIWNWFHFCKRNKTFKK